MLASIQVSHRELETLVVALLALAERSPEAAALVEYVTDVADEMGWEV